MNITDAKNLFKKAKTPLGYSLSDISVRNYISKSIIFYIKFY